MSRKKKPLSKRRQLDKYDRPTPPSAPDFPDTPDELAYVDTLPEEVKLVEVNSNIWGTKFKIHGIAKNIPANLGQISYKTSLLHLQPRQMTVVVTELREDFVHNEPDPNFNPNIFSEDEDDSSTAVTQPHDSMKIAQKRSNDLANTPIAPMSPRPNRFLKRNGGNGNGGGRSNQPFRSTANNTNNNNNNKPSTSSGGGSTLGPLAKAESYEDDFPNSEHSDTVSTTAATSSSASRPKNIVESFTGRSSSGPSYTSLVTQYSRSSSNSSGGQSSRHAISPLCCEGSVPTLQSPKNAVAPSDIIFDRPPAAGHATSVMSYCGSSVQECTSTNNIKTNALHTEQIRTHHHHHHHHIATTSGGQNATGSGSTFAIPSTSRNLTLHLDESKQKAAINKKPQKELYYIDEDNASSSTPGPSTSSAAPSMHRTPTVVSISPAGMFESITRSCSVGYLDSVEMVPSDVTLSILRKDAPNKRLVLVDRKPNRKFNKKCDIQKKKLIQCGKSKSLDSCDLFQEFINKNNNSDINEIIQKLHDTSETEGSSSDAVETTIVQINHCNSSSSSGSSSSGSNNNILLHQSILKKNKISKDSIGFTSNLFKEPSPADDSIIALPVKHPSKKQYNFDFEDQPAISKVEKKEMKKSKKSKSEVITSYTDSPLFSRKHRFGNDESTAGGSSSFSFIKQLSESRRRRREENKIELEVQSSTTTTEPKVSLHTQALTTLENIISRLRDLDENRVSNHLHEQRPAARSSPSSPALSKKSAKRNQTSSPIRSILNSPLLNRRNRKKQMEAAAADSSDDETILSTDNDRAALVMRGNVSGADKAKHHQYRDLETFQKAQLRQKVKYAI